tara:strand:+ start:6966 stop:7958 length:993 start_codon:yes stop_codon:yes gene_type:complete
MNILVTGVGSTLGYGILETISKSGLDCQLSGADYFETAVGLYKVDFPFILPDVLSSEVSDEDWLESVIEIIERQNINYVLVGLDFEVPLFAKFKNRIETLFACQVIVSSLEVVEICNDKWLTYCFLRDNGFDAPRSCLPSEIDSFKSEVQFPWIVKPRQGSTSNGLFRVTDMDTLSHALDNCDNPVIQEEVGISDEEYTCGVLSVNGEVLSSIALRRTLKNGNTTVAYYAQCTEIDSYIRRVAGKLGSFGPINIQLRLTETGPKIFEINPRFSGTTTVRACFGLNEISVLFNYFDKLNSIGVGPFREGMVIRHTTDKFVSKEDIDKLVIL